MEEPSSLAETSTAPDASAPEAPAVGAACKHDPNFQLMAPGCKCQRLLWPRRIHAAVGLLFTGFLLAHLAICATGASPALYQQTVNRVEAVLAHLPGLVLVAVFLPFVAQAALGLFLLRREGMKYDVKKCNRGGKLRFFTQRVTALMILGFFVIHVGTLHKWGLHVAYRLTHLGLLSGYASGGLFQPGDAFGSTVLGLNHVTGFGPLNLLWSLVTVVALWATAFHAANGAWTGGMVWKIVGTKTTGKLRKMTWGGFCWLIGISLAVGGSVALWAFAFSPAARLVLR